MVQFNFSERTIKAKVVYYGPPQSGKTTNLEQIHRITDPEGSNRLISLNTAQDRTLFFDLLPFSLGTVSGYDFKIQLYTVPGQVQYNATRRVVLAGADAVVFVADSQKAMARENLAAFENMKVNLLANRLVPEKVPLVLQYNKQDLESLVPRSELDRVLNAWGRKAFPAVASRGEGVMETFVAVVQDMLAAIAVKYNLKEKGLDPQAVPEIVAEAFTALVKKAPAPPSRGHPPPAPACRDWPAGGRRAGLPRPGRARGQPRLRGASPPRHPVERRARRGARSSGPRRQPGPRGDPAADEPARVGARGRGTRRGGHRDPAGAPPPPAGPAGRGAARGRRPRDRARPCPGALRRSRRRLPAPWPRPPARRRPLPRPRSSHLRRLRLRHLPPPARRHRPRPRLPGPCRCPLRSRRARPRPPLRRAWMPS